VRRIWKRAATTSAWESLAAEFRVLCLAARPPQPGTGAAALTAAIEEGVDWPTLVQAARRHRVVAMTLAGLRAHADLPMPPDILAQLRRLDAVNARRALAQAAELARLSAALAAAGVRMIALKGVAMSLQLHGDLATRGVGDIDLLVAPADFPAADAVLVASGYRRFAPNGDPIPGRVDWEAYRDLGYESPERGQIVELHQHLTANRHRLPQDFARLWNDRGEICLAGVQVAVLPERVLPLYLCVHGAEHCWERLCWLSDMAVLLRRPGAREIILADAATVGLGRTMRLALALAGTLLGDPCETNQDPEDEADVRRFVSRFFAGAASLRRPAPVSLDRLRFEAWRRFELFTLKAGWRHVWHELRSEFLNPVDRTVIPLPRRLRWLYPLLRPVGWVVRAVRRRGGAQRRT